MQSATPAAVILAMFCALPIPAVSDTSLPQISPPIVDVRLGTPTYFDYGGDSWDPTWAQDDGLYSAVNDGAGSAAEEEYCLQPNNRERSFGAVGTIAKHHGGIWCNERTGCDRWPELEERGEHCHRWDAVHVDRNGSICRPRLRGKADQDRLEHHQSNDHGLHWSRPMQANRRSPMFPGMRFATPFSSISAKNMPPRRWTTPTGTFTQRRMMDSGTMGTVTFSGRPRSENRRPECRRLDVLQRRRRNARLELDSRYAPSGSYHRCPRPMR